MEKTIEKAKERVCKAYDGGEYSRQKNGLKQHLKIPMTMTLIE